LQKQGLSSNPSTTEKVGGRNHGKEELRKEEEKQKGIRETA
jgi:hypothetical protein